eukprot:Sspe_Gene.71322::Locus_42251_Transcript_1_1_Confidence_1.000_Length_1264::g.71322::m.71322/K03660/OGG1; N-glycosylase/DNA lyase
MCCLHRVILCVALLSQGCCTAYRPPPPNGTAHSRGPNGKMAPTKMAWSRIQLRGPELALRNTLYSGQVFRWKEVGAAGADPKAEPPSFAGVLGRQVVELRQPSPNMLQFRAASREPARKALEEYFQLSVPLLDLAAEWATRGKGTSLGESLGEVTAIRVLRQDCEECLLSFLCTQNNHIQRITKMLDALCEVYGDPLGTFHGREWHAFPTVAQLAKVPNLEDQLRGMGFGYRASYVAETVKQLSKLDGKAPSGTWLRSLRGKDYATVLKALLALPGVGRKVADCVILFSMDRSEVVPIDTHILAIARQHIPGVADLKTLTPRVYNSIQEHFKEVFGEYAGWAHSVLFHTEITTPVARRREQRKAAAKRDVDSPTPEEKGKKKKTRKS